MLKKITFFFSLILFLTLWSCDQGANNDSASTTMAESTSEQQPEKGQSAVEDDVSQKNIIQITIASEDHSTLETAVKTAEMEDVLANPGPLTVFAPTNAAFEKLPEGTVASLLKPENKAKLKNIIEYHAAPGSYGPDNIAGVEGIGQANMEKVDVTTKDGETYVNDAKVIGSVKASNGWIHVIDGVLLPPEE